MVSPGENVMAFTGNGTRYVENGTEGSFKAKIRCCFDQGFVGFNGLPVDVSHGIFNGLHEGKYENTMIFLARKIAKKAS